MRGFQLWINLPAKDKMSSPAYQEYSPQALPVYEDNSLRVKILLGEYQGIKSPISDAITEVEYYDVTLQAGCAFNHSIPARHTAFIYTFENSAAIGGKVVPLHNLAALTSGNSLQVEAGDGAARFLLISGKPIGEPIVQYGPFVMNSEAEIRQAMSDYHAGRLVRERAQRVGD
jgi:redox-sensitive bicupin YhaK (pirin superfamily)